MDNLRNQAMPFRAGAEFSGPTAPRGRQAGVTLIELLVALVLGAVLATIGFEVYAGYVDDARQRDMLGQMKRLETLIERFRTDTGRLPADLAELGSAVPLDPYGNPYQYLNIEDAPPSVRGKVRKDRNLVPINSDYDLYSRGKDGDTRPPLTVPVSKDDFLRGGNGGYIGLAANF